MTQWPFSYIMSAAILLAVSTVGCQQQTAPQKPESVASPATTQTANTQTANVHGSPPQPDIQPPPDNSVALSDYFSAGMPAQDRAWTGSDMAAAAMLLQEFAKTDPCQLPRYGSPKSGELFARIVDSSNLEPFKDSSIPLGERLPNALELMDAGNQILKIYLDAFTKHQVADSELVELLGAQLRVIVVMIALVEELMPTVDRNAPNYSVRMEGLAKMKSGMAEVISGNLVTLTESHAYRITELKRLIGYQQITFPAIIPALTEDSQTSFITRLRTMAEDPQLQQLNPELEQLSKAVEQVSQP